MALDPVIIPHSNPSMKPYEDPSKFTSYIFDGTDVKEVRGSITVMISAAADLTDLAEKVQAGSIAYLAGWTQAWQLDTDGSTWVQFIGGED